MSFFSFPNPVNEKAARTVAAGVVVLSAITVFTQWWPLMVLIALGFLGRVLAGPRLSILGTLATKVIAPRLGKPVMVPGPPKRFAQALGLIVSSTAAILALGFGATTAATVVTVLLIVFASLESFAGFCFGCWIFGYLMRWGVIPEETCEACADIRTRVPS